jgi:uncharacterized protein
VQDLTVSVAEILGHPGEYRDLKVERPLPGVRVALAQLVDEPIQAALRLESVVEGILVTGEVQADARFTCARCLKEFPGDIDLDVCELYVGSADLEDVDEDAYEVSGTEVELEPMLRDAVTLALPLNPLCREDCMGLCSRCGRVLTSETCDCTEEDVDPRWAALDELRDKLGG